MIYTYFVLSPFNTTQNYNMFCQLICIQDSCFNIAHTVKQQVFIVRHDEITLLSTVRGIRRYHNKHGKILYCIYAHF